MKQYNVGLQFAKQMRDEKKLERNFMTILFGMQSQKFRVRFLFARRILFASDLRQMKKKHKKAVTAELKKSPPAAKKIDFFNP